MLMAVIFINTFIFFLVKTCKLQKENTKMHELFKFKTVEEAPTVAIVFVGFLDMAYAFLLFWPANVLPVPVLLVLM